ncbi:phage tail assembly chaperone [Maricaulis maris]|uniref:Putative phage protein (TIGR02216 family) n=1 Tax=Maricaulis maris TaxID=74318 RepID=A0A495D154_9PROT|nr:phage tail assembly chaperone [Maricaulis maris]RKQ95252.1 putative phage protein (TIGR02216 family) [Maricaulis maris]
MNWAAILRTGLALGLMPDALWRLSLVEWRALTAASGPPPLDRAGLDALRARFPDNSGKEAER